MANTKTKNSTKIASAKPAELNQRAETKKDRVLALLRREGGATLDQVVEDTGWLPHTTRAVFTGLRKKGFTLQRARADGVTRYAITAEPSA
jgi:hypothetical protein